MRRLAAVLAMLAVLANGHVLVERIVDMVDSDPRVIVVLMLVLMLLLVLVLELTAEIVLFVLLLRMLLLCGRGGRRCGHKTVHDRIGGADIVGAVAAVVLRRFRWHVTGDLVESGSQLYVLGAIAHIEHPGEPTVALEFVVCGRGKGNIMYAIRCIELGGRWSRCWRNWWNLCSVGHFIRLLCAMEFEENWGI